MMDRRVWRFIGFGIALVSLLILMTGGTLLENITAQGAVTRFGDGDDSALLSAVQANGTISVIVGFQSPTGIQAAQRQVEQAAITAERHALITSLTSVGSAVVISNSERWLIPFVALQVDQAALLALMASPQVTSIRENQPLELTLNTSIPVINADDLWSLGFDGTGYAVAVLDTGTHAVHPALTGHVVAEACFSGGLIGSTSLCPNLSTTQTGSGAASPNRCDSLFTGDDACYHGTHVSGTSIGSNSANSIHGVARAADLIALNVFSKRPGASTRPTAYISDIIAGLNHVYALRFTYSIAAVNMSFGSGLFSVVCDDEEPAMTTLFNSLRAADIMPVVSSGNNGSTTRISFPACISSAVSVGATTDGDVRASFSNSLPSLMSLFAPGASIFAPVIPGSRPDGGSGYGFLNGTSMAAPHVTGAFALLRHAVPGATSEEIYTALRNTGQPITVPGGTTPRINVLSAYHQLVGSPTPTFTLTGRVELQGRPPKPSAAWALTLEVIVKPTDGGAAVFSGSVTTDQNGVFTLSSLPANTYSVGVKHSHTLRNVVTVNMVGNTDQHFGTLLEGDADDDNTITISDFSILTAAFGYSSGHASYDARADFNDDSTVSIGDFSLLATNFGQTGAAEP